MSESRKSGWVEGVGRAYIGELEEKGDGRCRVWLGNPCSLEERKAALLEKHCCLERGSFSGSRRELFRRRRQRSRCDPRLEAC